MFKLCTYIYTVYVRVLYIHVLVSVLLFVAEQLDRAFAWTDK